MFIEYHLMETKFIKFDLNSLQLVKLKFLMT